MINTLLTIDEIDNRIAEIEAQIEILSDLRGTSQRSGDGDDRASKLSDEIDALETELDPLESFSRSVTRSGTDSDAVDAALDYAAGDLDQAEQLIRYGVNEYASVREYGEQIFDGCYAKNSDLYGFASYIDFEAYGRDCLMDAEYHEFQGSIYVFTM